MDMEQLIRIKLEALGKPMVDSGYPFILTTCLSPDHPDKHPSFSVNLETGAGKCFGCGFYVSDKYWINGEMSEEEIEELLRKNKYSSLKNKFKKEEEVAPMVFLPPKDADVEDGWRGLTRETLDKLQIYICNTGKYAGRVIFPMQNEYGNIAAFNTRALSADIKPKYKYSYGIKVDDLVYPNTKLLKELNKPYVVVVEGIMDAISMYQDGIPAILNFGVNNTIKSKKIGELLKLGVETIYLGLDNDEAGTKGTMQYLESDLNEFFTLKLARTLPELQDFYNSGEKDYNDYIQKRKGV
jgi:DNA primase